VTKIKPNTASLFRKWKSDRAVIASKAKRPKLSRGGGGPSLDRVAKANAAHSPGDAMTNAAKVVGARAVLGVKGKPASRVALRASLDPCARPKPMVDKKPCCGGAVTAKRPKHSEGAPERRSTATTRRGFAVSYVFIPDTALSAAADRGRVWPSARGRTIAVGSARSRRWSPRQWRDDGKPPQGGN